MQRRFAKRMNTCLFLSPFPQVFCLHLKLAHSPGPLLLNLHSLPSSLQLTPAEKEGLGFVRKSQTGPPDLTHQPIMRAHREEKLKRVENTQQGPSPVQLVAVSFDVPTPFAQRPTGHKRRKQKKSSASFCNGCARRSFSLNCAEVSSGSTSACFAACVSKADLAGNNQL